MARGAGGAGGALLSGRGRDLFCMSLFSSARVCIRTWCRERTGRLLGGSAPRLPWTHPRFAEPPGAGMLPPPSPRCHFPSSELGGRPELHKQGEEQRPGEGRPPDPAKTRGCALALPPPGSRTALYFESRQGAAPGARPAGARAHGTDGGRNAEASGGGAFMRRGRWGRGHERFPTLANQSAARTGRSAGAPRKAGPPPLHFI